MTRQASPVDGGPAFPNSLAAPTNDGYLSTSGMTLRDYFAAKAMNGLILNEAEDGAIGSDNVEAVLATLSYRIADAMLAARRATLTGDTEA